MSTYKIKMDDYVATCTITYDAEVGFYDFETKAKPEDVETVEDKAWDLFRKEREEQRELAQENYTNRFQS